MTRDPNIYQLFNMVVEENRLLKERIFILEERLSHYEQRKNSSNSSTPPSQDPFREKRTTSLREKSGKKPGGQPGHRGSTLEFTERPDKVIKHKSRYCKVCGKDLTGLVPEFSGRRQVIDIPPIQPQITEHKIYSYRCSCGHCQVSDCPAEAHSPVVGADETGVCINGKNHWAWTFQSPNATFIDIDASRGKKVIDRIFGEGFPESTLVHDCWRSYFNTVSHAHQICTAHLLRELKYLTPLYKDDWSKDFTRLLTEALKLKRELVPADYLRPNEKRKLLEERLDELRQQLLDPKHKKLITFKNRLMQYRHHLFRFLYQYDVPPDNNASERAVRTFKVKQKISGLFRSSDGAKTFAIIRSVIDTSIKNYQNVWVALNCIAVGVE